MNSQYICLPYQTVIFEIKTNCIDILDALSLLYGRYISSHRPMAGETIFIIEIVKQQKQHRVYTVTQDIITTNPLQVIKDILYENTKYYSSIIALHGAAVEYCGKAYLFLASTTSGKSTLTSYLIQNGMGYITDDCILIDRTSLAILPMATPIHLRDGGLKVLTKMNLDLPELTHLHNTTIDRYIYLPDSCVCSPLAIAKIYFILRDEKENEVREIAGIHALMRLVKSRMVPCRITQSDMEIFQEFAGRGCEEIMYKDLEYVYSLICER